MTSSFSNYALSVFTFIGRVQQLKCWITLPRSLRNRSCAALCWMCCKSGPRWSARRKPGFETTKYTEYTNNGTGRDCRKRTQRTETEPENCHKRHKKRKEFVANKSMPG